MAALSKINGYFAGENLNSVLPFAGANMTLGEVLSIVNNTKFVITDAPSNNGGVGSAARLADGTTIDTLYYDAFDGDNNDYASPLYSNMEGMVGILLHEVGHMSESGSRFNTQSHHYYNLEHSKGLNPFETFETSQYWTNNEAFANDFALTVASTVGADINEWHPTQGFDYKQPSDIFFGL